MSHKEYMMGWMLAFIAIAIHETATTGDTSQVMILIGMAVLLGDSAYRSKS